MDELRLLTWNLLRHDGYRPYAWPAMLRREALIRGLPTICCDLACFQEVSPACLRLLARLLPDFAWHPGRAPSPSSRLEEALPIAWRRERFSALGHDSFRLGPCATTERGRFEPPRPCSWLRLQDRDGTRLLVANLHFAHEAERRRRDARILARRLCQLAGQDPVLVAGDFNSQPDDPIFSILAEHGLQRMPQRPRSLNLFGLPLLAIDAVLASSPWRCSRVDRISGRAGPIFASDHFGLLATLRRH